MSDRDIDWVIVGQGLAGTAMAWRLIEAGQRVLVVDPGETVTSSRIAGGLVTPITGQNLALAWSSNAERLEAEAFYRRIEARTRRSFYHQRTAIRLFANAAEASRWARKQMQPGFQAHLQSPQPSPLVDPEVADAAHGGFAMHAGQLDISTYLDASAQHLPIERRTFDWKQDVTFLADVVEVVGRRAQGIIACEGNAVRFNPYFDWLPSRAAKGEILTIRTSRALPPVTLHRGIWVAPTSAPDLFKVGATFDRGSLDNHATADGRVELEAKLRTFFRVPYEVVDHQAAVRPIVATSHPALGIHPRHARLGILNGLAAKGVVRAPVAAAALVARLLRQTPLPPADDIARFV